MNVNCLEIDDIKKAKEERRFFMREKRVAKKIMVLGMAGIMLFGGTLASARTFSPYASRNTGGVQLKVMAWFNSGYKTTDDDEKYNVKPGRYIKQCWVRIKEGNYDKVVKSKSYTKKEAKNGQATLSKYNNPFADASLTWGWKYN